MSFQNELIIQIMTESHEIDDLKRKIEDAKMKLVTEIKVIFKYYSHAVLQTSVFLLSHPQTLLVLWCSWGNRLPRSWGHWRLNWHRRKASGVFWDLQHLLALDTRHESEQKIKTPPSNSAKSRGRPQLRPSRHLLFNLPIYLSFSHMTMLELS